MDLCDLHIPHKDWSGDPREQQNYAEMERWSQRLRTLYLGSGTPVHGIFTRAFFTGSVTVPDDTVQLGVFVDFSTLTRADQIGDQTQLTNNTTAGNEGLNINHNGFFTWFGYAELFSAVTYFNVQQHLNNPSTGGPPGFGALSWDTRTSTDFQFLPLGGGMFTESGTEFQLKLRQATGGSQSVSIFVGVTLLQL